MKTKKFIITSLCILSIFAACYGYYIKHDVNINKKIITFSEENNDTSHTGTDNTSNKSPYDLSFAVFGDVHDNEPDFQDAIDDMKKTDIKVDALVLNGDTVDQGIDSQYETMSKVLKNNKKNLPDIIIKNIGNHEFYDYDNGTNSKQDVNTKIQRYLNFAHEDNVYHDRWINDYHFISLGSEDGNSDTNDTMNAFISNKQLNWFKEKLAEKYEKGRPIFVFIHQPLTLNWGWGNISGTNKSDTLKKLLSDYPEVILFTSHTHKQLNESCMDDTKNYTTLQTGAISYTLSRKDDGSFSRDFSSINGLYVTVIGNEVTINGRDIKNHQWLFSKNAS